MSSAGPCSPSSGVSQGGTTIPGRIEARTLVPTNLSHRGYRCFP
jgi:hypothetical protein